jgi:peptidoglycan L-alanyl-D-glutamate endopeptidase CwlK
MPFSLSTRSEYALQGVNPDLVRVVRRAITLTNVDFVVTEGLRTPERQAELVKAGASKTLNSRHITGHAVDLAPIIAGQVRWDWPPFHELARAMKQAAAAEGVAIVWGGSWTRFRDGPHFELDRKAYP